MNIYAYGANDPVNGTDPSGMIWQVQDEILVTGTRFRYPSLDIFDRFLWDSWRV